MWHRSFI